MGIKIKIIITILGGIYEKNEWQDKESFDKQHLLVGPEAKIEFQEQLVAGEQIAENYYILCIAGLFLHIFRGILSVISLAKE